MLNKRPPSLSITVKVTWQSLQKGDPPLYSLKRPPSLSVPTGSITVKVTWHSLSKKGTHRSTAWKGPLLCPFQQVLSLSKSHGTVSPKRGPTALQLGMLQQKRNTSGVVCWLFQDDEQKTLLGQFHHSSVRVYWTLATTRNRVNRHPHTLQARVTTIFFSLSTPPPFLPPPSPVGKKSCKEWLC